MNEKILSLSLAKSCGEKNSKALCIRPSRLHNRKVKVMAVCYFFSLFEVYHPQTFINISNINTYMYIGAIAHQ